MWVSDYRVRIGTAKDEERIRKEKPVNELSVRVRAVFYSLFHFVYLYILIVFIYLSCLFLVTLINYCFFFIA